MRSLYAGNRFRRSLRTVSLVEDILNAVETRVCPSTVTTTCISSELPCRSIVTVGWIEISIDVVLETRNISRVAQCQGGILTFLVLDAGQNLKILLSTETPCFRVDLEARLIVVDWAHAATRRELG